MRKKKKCCFVDVKDVERRLIFQDFQDFFFQSQTQTQTQTHLFKQDCRKSITTYLSCAPVRRE